MVGIIKKVLIAVTLFTSAITAFAAPDVTKCIGFASIDGKGNQTLAGGVTGGAGGQVVTVTNVDDLVKYCNQEGPLTIIVEGTIQIPNDKSKGTLHVAQKPNPGFSSPASLPYSIFVKSDKTIIGKGSNAMIKSGGFVIGSWDETYGFLNDVNTPPENTVHNIIIQNITFDLSGGPKSETDGVSIFMHAHHIWVDHCTFKNAPDGALDIKRGASYCTFSYNHFIGIHKTCLCGSGDDRGKQDTGFLKSTYHHNYFQNCKSRQPRVRFGEVHVFNNYFKGIGNYAIGVGAGSQIYSENNNKDGGSSFSTVMGPSSGGLKDVGSIGGSSIKPERVKWNPKDFYTYPLESANEVKNTVTSYAGAGKVDFKVGVTNTGFKPVADSHSAKNIQSSVFSLLGKKVTSNKEVTPNNAANIYIIQNKSTHKKIISKNGQIK